MSFWSRLGDAYDAVGDFGAGVAFDITTATIGRNMDREALEATRAAYVGNREVFRDQRNQAIVESLEVPYRELVARPHSTVSQQLTRTQRGESFFKGWGESYDRSNFISPGQAAVAANVALAGNVALSDEERQALGQSNNSIAQLVAASADLSDDKTRHEIFTENRNFRIMSGLVDAGIAITGDPLNALGGVGAGARAARWTARSADETAAIFADDALEAGGKVTRQRTALEQFIARTDGMTVSELAQTDFLRQTSDAGALAYWMGRANADFAGDEAARHAAKRDILGAAAGDQPSLARLRERNELLAAEVENMTANIQELDDLALAVEVKWDHGLMLEQRNAVDELKITQRQRDQIIERIERERRVIANDAGIGLRDFSKAGAGSFGESRRMARVQSVIHEGAGVHPILFVTGQRLPGVVDVRSPSVESADVVRDLLAGTRKGIIKEASVRRGLYDEYLAASTREQRSLVLMKIENAIFAGVAKKNGLKDMAQLRALQASARTRKGAMINMLKTRLYSAADEDGYALMRDADGDEMFAFASDPVLTSQLEGAVAIVDPRELDRVVRRLNGTGNRWDGFVTSTGADKVWEITEWGLSQANSLWKLGALLRVAYPIRNQIDSQARLAASLHGQYLTLMANAGRNAWRNRTGRLSLDDQLSVVKRTQIQAKLDEIEGLPGREAEVAALREEMKKPARARIGMMGESHKGISTDAYLTEDERTLAQLMNSSSDSIANLTLDMADESLRKMRSTGNWDRIAGDKPEWSAAYLRAVNKQIRNDALARRILAGDSNVELRSFLNRDPQGQAAWANFRKQYDNNMDAYIERVRAHVDAVLPDQAMRSTVIQRTVTEADLAAWWKVPADRPAVPGEVFTDEAQSLINRISQKWFHAAGVMPEDTLARHPFYTARFSAHMREQIDNLPDTTNVSAAQVLRMRQHAAQMARRDMQQTLFHQTRQSNLAYATRFIMPFFAAWEDSMTKWTKILSDNPMVFAAMPDAWEAPNDIGIVQDRDGNIIKGDGFVYDKVTGERVKDSRTGKPRRHGTWESGQYITIPLPDSIERKYGWAEARFDKAGLNVMFQGDPWYAPGWGPMASIPANEVYMRAFPEAANDHWLAKWMLPYGLEGDSKDLALPAWMRRGNAWASSMLGGNPTQDFATLYVQLHQEELNAFNRGERDTPPTEDEITQKVRNSLLLRFIASNTSPVSTTPGSRLEFYKQRYNAYRNLYGVEADERFREDFPEFTEMAISLSSNETGVNATEEAWLAIQPYRDDIAENPELGWFYAGAANLTGEFDQGAYEAQRSQTINSSTSQTFRSTRDPMEAIARADANAGWTEFHKGMDLLRLELEKRGLHSFNQKLAIDSGLKEARDKFIAQLRVEHQSWSKDYDQRDGRRVARFLETAISSVNDHHELAKRSDMLALQEYVQGRRYIRGLLQKRENKSLERNPDIEAAWEQFVAELVASDLGFGQMYDRMLEGDDLTTEVNIGG